MGAALAAAASFVQALVARAVPVLVALPPAALACSEALVALPAVALCVLACWDQADEGPRATLLRAVVPVAAALLVAEGLLCASLRLATWQFALIDLAVFLPLFWRITGLTPSQTAFVVMTNVLLATAITYAAILVDAYAVGNQISDSYLAWPGMLTQWGLVLVTVPLLWHPARHAVPHLLASEAVEPRTWRALWLIPALLTVGIQMLRPDYVEAVRAHGVAPALGIGLFCLADLTVLVYVLLWRMLRLYERQLEAERSLRTAQLAQEQVAHLNERIESARRDRHDLRHHVNILRTFLDAGDVAAARAYLDEFSSGRRLDDAPIRYCENDAVSAVLVYYCDAARKLGVRVDVVAQVPARPPQRETDVCAVLSNLLENAVDALRDVAAGSGAAGGGAAGAAGGNPLELRIRVEARPAGLFMTVDNTCLPSTVRQDGERFVSAKPGSHGLGIASVRETARRTGGVARFALDGNTFRASVMLG